MPAIEMSNPAALPADWRDILALTKPRVMSLVVFTGLCGLLVAPVQLPVVLGFTAILCIALGAGARGAPNHGDEAGRDAQMRRTPHPPRRIRRRPPLTKRRSPAWKTLSSLRRSVPRTCRIRRSRWLP